MKKLTLICLILLLGACASHPPSKSKTARLSTSYFKSYGKKFKESPLGQNPVTDAQVRGVEGLQRNVSTALVDLTLQDGSQLPVLVTLIRKIPLGWRVKSWEKVQTNSFGFGAPVKPYSGATP